MPLKHSWKWLSPRFTGRHLRGENVPVIPPASRPPLAAMESLDDRIMLSAAPKGSSEIIIEPPGGVDNAQVLMTLFKGGLALSQDEFSLLKLIGDSSPPSPLPLPYPNQASKVSLGDIVIIKTTDKASNLLLKLDDAIFDLGENLIKGELTAQKIAASKDKIEFLKIELKDIIVSSLSADDQQKIDPVLESLDANVALLVNGLSKLQGVDDPNERATYWKLAGDILAVNELLIKGEFDFIADKTRGLVPQDFQQKIDAVLSKDFEAILSLSDPTAQKVLLGALNEFALGTQNLLGSLSGGGDFDGGILVLGSTDDVIT